MDFFRRLKKKVDPKCFILWKKPCFLEHCRSKVWVFKWVTLCEQKPWWNLPNSPHFKERPFVTKPWRVDRSTPQDGDRLVSSLDGYTSLLNDKQIKKNKVGLKDLPVSICPIKNWRSRTTSEFVCLRFSPHPNGETFECRLVFWNCFVQVWGD